MLCRHAVMSMQIVEVSWVVYWVTVVVGGDSEVMMACWNAWRLSDSLSSPQILCRCRRLVTIDSLSL